MPNEIQKKSNQALNDTYGEKDAHVFFEPKDRI